MGLNSLKWIIEESYIKYNQDILLNINHVMERHWYILTYGNIIFEEYGCNDILEIGAYEGLSTIIYLRYAFDNEFYVNVIDPWNGKELGTDKAYRNFCGRVEPYKENLVVRKIDSTSEEAKNYINKLNLAFSYVDGLHTYENALGDISNCMDAGSLIISVDDVRGYVFSNEIMMAVKECQRIYSGKYDLIHSPNNIQETYFVKRNMESC
jgi:hypothetical protein